METFPSGQSNRLVSTGSDELTAVCDNPRAESMRNSRGAFVFSHFFNDIASFSAGVF